MSREDWDVFDIIKAERQAERAERRSAFLGGDGWVRHHETHWSYQLNGIRLDYWPGTKRWRWGNRKGFGEVLEFIAKHEIKAIGAK